MIDFSVSFIVMVSIIGILSIFTLVIAMQATRQITSREKSARFPAVVEITLGISEAMEVVRNALLQQRFAGVQYSITGDDIVTGSIRAIASGVPTGAVANQAIDISVLVFFVQVTDDVTQIERNYVVRSVVNDNVDAVILATNDVFDKLLIPLYVVSQVQIAVSQEDKHPTISTIKTSNSIPDVVSLPVAVPLSNAVSSPEAVTIPIAVQTQSSVAAESASPKTCPSCNYRLDAAFTFCLHCGIPT